MKKILILIIFINSSLAAQDKLVTNAEIKLLADLNVNKLTKLTNFRLNFGMNFKRFLDSKNQLFVAVSPNINIMFFHGLGGSIYDTKFRLIRPNVVFSGSVGYEFNDKKPIEMLTHKVMPFSALNSVGFMSDKNYVFALASNFILVDFLHSKQVRCQRIGSLFVGINRFEFSYYNDGPPFDTFKFGDGGDRYFTGGGYVGVVLPKQKIQGETPTIRFSFDRYTGYVKDAYEVANYLKMDFIPHKDVFTNLFNRGSIRAGVFTNSSSAEISFNDFESLDVQYLIHKIRGFSMHRTANDPSVSLQFSYTHEKLFNK